jgi:hypothetical protein
MAKKSVTSPSSEAFAWGARAMTRKFTGSLIGWMEKFLTIHEHVSLRVGISFNGIVALSWRVT